jgi:hypothetical membrane protein
MHVTAQSPARPLTVLASGRPAAGPQAPAVNARVQRLLLSCGIAGPLLFTGVYLADGLARPGYHGWQQPISELGVGPGGWVQSADFIVFGVLSLAFTVALRQALVPGAAATWGPLLRAVGALGLLLDGAFPAGPLHQAGDTLTFTALPLACFVLARRFAKEPGWRGWATYSVATGIGFWALLAVFTATNTGGYEKLAAGMMSAWLLLLAARLLARGGHVTARP